MKTVKRPIKQKWHKISSAGWNMRFPFMEWEQRKLLVKVVAAFSVPTIILLAVTVFYIVESSLAINLALKVSDV